MIEIKHLVKCYPGEKEPTLKDITMTINTGEFFGILGPNGAGKTTMIKVLSTLLLANSGEVQINGEILTRQSSEIKKKLSMITQEFSLRSTMTPMEIMELQGRLYGMKRKEIRERSVKLLEFCGFDANTKKVCRKLSGGMKRKLMIARGLLTNPDILILDEPTVGVDPFSRRQIWDMLKQLHSEGKTILLTTHYIDEAQYLCNRVALLDCGMIQQIKSPKELIHELGSVAVDCFIDGTTKSHFFAARQEAIAFISALGEEEYVMRNTTLEDVFLHLVGKNLEVK